MPLLGLKGPEEGVDSSTQVGGCLVGGIRSPWSRDSAIATTREGSRVKSIQPGPQPRTCFLLCGLPRSQKARGLISAVRARSWVNARVGRGRGRRKWEIHTSRMVCSSAGNRIRLEVFVGFLGSSFLLFYSFSWKGQEAGRPAEVWKSKTHQPWSWHQISGDQHMC